MQEVINLLLMSVFTFIIGAIVKRTRVRKARNMKKSIFDIKQDRPAKRIQQALYKERDKDGSKLLSPLEWQQAEINVLWNAVNDERKKIGKGPIRITRIEDVEKTAFGHIDYVHKIAIYCEELVYE